MLIKLSYGEICSQSARPLPVGSAERELGMLHLCWEGGGGGSELGVGRKVVPNPLSSAAVGEVHPPGGCPTAPAPPGGIVPLCVTHPAAQSLPRPPAPPKTAGRKACSKDSAFGRVETGLGGCSSFFGWDRLLAPSPVAICSSEPSRWLPALPRQRLGTLTRMLRDISIPAQGFQGSSNILGLAPSRAGMSKPGSIRCWQRCRMR